MLYGNGQSMRWHNTVGANLLLEEKRREREESSMRRAREWRALRGFPARVRGYLTKA